MNLLRFRTRRASRRGFVKSSGARAIQGGECTPSRNHAAWTEVARFISQGADAQRVRAEK